MRRIGLFLILTLFLSACVTGPVTPYSTMPGSYQHHQQAFHIKIHWNFKDPGREVITDLKKFLPTKQTLTLEGIIENYSGSAEVFDVEILVMAYDQEGNFLGSVTGRPRDYILQPEQISPFVVQMPMTGKEVRLAIKEKYEWRDRSRR